MNLLYIHNMSKSDTISKVYYDPAGYGSIATTFKDARKKDNTITLNDVKQWFKDNVEQKKQLRGYNSFIAPHANYEYQVDLFFINDLPDQKFKVGLIMIDVFSKYMVVVPIKTKQPGDVAAGIIEGLHKMGATPKMIYTDDEGSLSTESIQTYFKEKNIKHVITRGHAAVAERAIRTFKDMLYKRIDGSKKDKVQWTDYIFEVLLTYNNKLEHKTTGMTPEKARKADNKHEVWTNTFVKSKQNRTYPELNVGDKVKIFRKKKKGEKERTSVWSNNVYEIEGTSEALGQVYYKLVGVGREYLRHELLKV